MFLQWVSILFLKDGSFIAVVKSVNTAAFESIYSRLWIEGESLGKLNVLNPFSKWGNR